MFLAVDLMAKRGALKCARSEVGIKDLAPNLAWNMRQEWFMQQVTVRHSCTSKDIEQHWRVTRRTAKRDIAGLVAAGAIRFIRLGKGGYYMAEL